ncbi:TonB-dependent receptor [Pseudoduganella plicata]|uniref:TonB-dependent receptor n=1 Tax=Pseudoduganella plicata TaxID=321984 RepID=A0A4P7BAC2_9BURK|nr:TonB-dependent receptor [Pseudoduganella plicata]QBQ34923.1 TonB-dependent receptor [Pseudoduganella plicata]GGY89695.1 TonB-dependent receptor [Pseudoduganella plicata]
MKNSKQAWVKQALPAAVALALAGVAAAQDGAAAKANDPSVVVVTGFRASLNSALNTKRNSDGIVDVIKAEDIAKFPDANLAESLQRVPGVALARGDGGEGKQITVRGLNAGFTRVRINGIEGVAATGSSDINGSTNRSRGFDFSVFASELFNSLEVRKTSQADVEEGSLGATVDLRTARPFDFKGRTFSLGAQEFHNTLTDKTQPRMTALLSDRWETAYGKFGALISGAYARRRATEEGYEGAELLSASADGGFCSPLGASVQNPASNAVKGIDAASCGFGVPRSGTGAAWSDVMGRLDTYGGTIAAPAGGSGAYHPRIPRYRRSQTDYERTGITSAFQWRPSPATDVNLDLMYGKFSNKRYDNYISAISFGRTLAQANGKPQTSIVDAHFDENGSWDYGKFNGVDIRTEGLMDVYTTNFRQHVLSGGHKFSDRLKVNFLHGTSDSELDEPMRATVQLDAPNVNGFEFDFRNNRNVPRLNFGIDVANPDNFTFAPQEADGTLHGQFVGRYLNTRNKLKTTELNGSWEVNDRLTVKAGASRRTNTWDNHEIGSGGNGLPLPAGVTLASLTRQIGGFGSGLGGAGVPSSWAAVDLDKLRAVYDIECHCSAVPGSEYNVLGQSTRRVEEKIDALFGMVDFNYDLAGIVWRGNVGVRGAETEATSMALINAAGAMVPNVVTKKYRDWLPALNLTAQLPRDVFLRFSAGKTLSRPEYVDLAPSATVAPFAQTVTIGNAELDPIRAKTYDLQAEWYYDRNAMVSVGVFRKEIDSFIQTVSERAVYSSLGLPDALLLSGGCSLTGTPGCPTLPSTNVVVSRKVNTPGGPLNGLELNLQAPFNFLPGKWSNFGLLANYTYVKSKITYITRVDNPTTAANEQLTVTDNFTGLSPRAANLTLYYEDPKFSARVSAAHRSSYLLAVLGDVLGHDNTTVDASTNVDFSLSYNLSPQLRVSFEGQNVTDEPLR